MKAVVLYQAGDDLATQAPLHFPAHRARIQEFADRSEILMVGTFGDPRTQGSMAVFPSRASAEAFVAGDPFVLEGVVKSWEIRDWNEILT